MCVCVFVCVGELPTKDTKEAIALAKMKEDAFTHGILAVLLAGVCAPLSSIVFLYFTKHYTECVVWCSLERHKRHFLPPLQAHMRTCLPPTSPSQGSVESSGGVFRFFFITVPSNSFLEN